MSTTCSHGRKAWNCRLCKIAEAQAFDAKPMVAITLNDEWERVDVTSMADAVERATKEIKEFGSVAGRAAHGKPNIMGCPVPRELYDRESVAKGMLIESWEVFDNINEERYYKLTFREGDQRYTQMIADHVVKQHGYNKKHKEELDPYQGVRDSDYILKIMSNTIGRAVEYAEGTYIIDALLSHKYQVPGRRAPKLDGPPAVDRHSCKFMFPTTNGIKNISELELMEFLHREINPVFDYSQAEARIAAHMGLELCGSIHDSDLYGIKPQSVADISFGKGNPKIDIKGPCEITINGKSLMRCVREGDKLIFINKEYKKLC